MTSLRARLAVFTVLACASALSHSQGATAESRGQLLYNTHCISCHTSQMHWRDGRLASDWDTLKGQVRRWQGVAGLQWGDADIAEVTRHLNDTIYKFPQTADRVSVVVPRR